MAGELPPRREFYTKKQKKQTTTAKMKPPAASTGKPPKPPRMTMTTGKRGQVHPAVTARRPHRRAVSSCDTCGVRDGFRPVVSAAEEQVRKGFAVVKCSWDPTPTSGRPWWGRSWGGSCSARRTWSACCAPTSPSTRRATTRSSSRHSPTAGSLSMAASRRNRMSVWKIREWISWT